MDSDETPPSSTMPNPSGANGHKPKNCMLFDADCQISSNLVPASQSDPSDNILRESLLKYSRRGLTQSEKLARLVDDHQLDIGYVFF